jgi:hypothetical protein
MLHSLVHRALLTLALAAPAGAQTVLFSDSFENGLGNWNATGLWNLQSQADSCGSFVVPFPDGQFCAYYGIPGVCNYDTGTAPNSGSLTLNAPIQLPAGAPAASLHCWTRHMTEGCGPGNIYDIFNIEVSANGGGSWTALGLRCTGKLEAPFAWEPRGIDLTPYLGQAVLVRFRFDTVDPLHNDSLGAFVDKVEIRLEAGHAFCATTCPCVGPFNVPVIGYGGISGCTNSARGDGELAGGGTPSVSSDSLVLIASHLPPSSVAILYQSDTSSSGAFAGDGRFCLTGTRIPLQVLPSSNGAVAFPTPSSPPLSVLGNVPPTGGTRLYQVTYRDPALYCTPSPFNQTNGYSIAWTP